MSSTGFQRARSAEAKLQRQSAILDAARGLARERVIRDVTLTDIAEAVGMHKSALLRYFETREQIFLELTADGWSDWGPAVCATLEKLDSPNADTIAHAIAASLAERPMFCDLLAQAPLNLERNVSLDAVLAFKLVTLDEVTAISSVLRELIPILTEGDAIDLVATATSLSGAFFQMATPGRAIELLYRSDPRLTHAIVDAEPRVARVLSAMIRGLETADRA
jgi:AcrR family transcriptional regulator